MLHCSGAEVRREAIPKRGRKLLRSRFHQCFGVLFIRKFRYDSRWWVPAPLDENRRVWYCFWFLFEKGM